MTKKDYFIIAKIIKSISEYKNDNTIDDNIILKAIKELKKDNSRFNSDKFEKAVKS